MAAEGAEEDDLQRLCNFHIGMPPVTYIFNFE